MVTKNQIKKISQDSASQIISIIQDLVKTPSVAVIDSQEPITKKIVKIAKELGLESQIFAEDEERAVFVGENFDKKEGAIIFSGYGTVDLGEHYHSTYDPFTPFIRDNKLYGSGAWKMKGTVGLSLYVKKILTDLGYGHLLKCVYTNSVGTKVYDGIRMILDKGLQGRLALIGGVLLFNDDKAFICTGCRGVLRLKVNITRVVPNLTAKVWQKNTADYNPIDYFTKFWEEMKLQLKAYPADPSFPNNIGSDQVVYKINGGTGFGLSPNYLTASISLLSAFTLTSKEYLQIAKSVADKLSSDAPVQFELEVIYDVPPVQLEDTKFKDIFAQEITNTLGLEVYHANDYYLDPLYYLQQKNIPTAFAQCLTGANQNTVDEYLNIDTIPEFAEILVTSILKEAGVEIGEE
jgi:acetylornithine deacetylase/succinyl-diaminopimelate desuccinylase-like protein